MPSIEFDCPQCGSHIQVVKTSAGLTSPCPSCREWIRLPMEAPAAPSAGYPPRVHLKESTTKAGEIPPEPAPSRHVAHASAPPHHGVAVGGWSCLAISLVLMFVHWDFWFVFAPLLMVALILGVVAMARGHILSGQTLLVATLSLPVLVAVKVHNMALPGIFALRAPDETLEAEGLSVEPAPPGVIPSPGDLAPPPAPEGAAGKEELREETGPAAAGDEAPAPPLPEPFEANWGEELPEPAPDWEERYDYWFELYSNRFVPPRAGMYVKIQLKEGGIKEGQVRKTDIDSMTLQMPTGHMLYEKTRLSEDTRRRFFQIDFAKYHALRKVREEREGYEGG